MPSFLTAWAMCVFALIQYSHSSALSFGDLSKKYPCGQRQFLQYWIHHCLLVLKWHRQIGGLELFLKEVQKCVSDIHLDFARALHQAHCKRPPYMFKAIQDRTWHVTNQSPKPLENRARLAGGGAHRSHLLWISIEAVWNSNWSVTPVCLQFCFKKEI